MTASPAQETVEPQDAHMVPDETLGHSGFHCAGAFTRSKKQLQTGAAADQMLAIDKQMQELLGRMQRHNQLIAAQHQDTEKRHEVRLFHKQTISANSVGSMTDSARWPVKIDFSLFDKNDTQSACAVRLGLSFTKDGSQAVEVVKPRTPGHVDSGGEGSRASARIPAQLGGPLWGATEGGRDKLGWVRQLVKYTETHPIYIADSASSAVEVLQNGSIQKTVFPSLKPNRREDALLLQQWLADMMAQLTANAPSSPADQAQVDMADAALWLYGIAFEELQRHIAVECRERAQVLACLWEHSTSLTELRCAVQYEGLLAQSRKGFDSLADQRTYLEGQISGLRQQVEELAEQRSADAQQAQREIELGSRHLAAAQQQLQFKADIIHQLTGGLQAETEQKENFAAALAANRKALDESRQERGSLRYEVDAKNRKGEALATELHLTETSLSERQAEVALLKGHERDYLQKIATLEEKYVKLQRDAEADVVLLQAVREQLTVRDGELAQSQQELAEQKGRCSSMEVSMNAEMASRERTERELRTAYLQRDAVQGQLDRMIGMRQQENEAFRRDLEEAASSKVELADQLSDARAEAGSWQHQLAEAREVQDSLKDRLRLERTLKQKVEQEVEDLGTKLNTFCGVFEETGMTMLDLKAAKMVTGTEDGLTVRKFLNSAKPAQLMDLSKLHIKKLFQKVPELEKSTAVAVEKMRLEEAARRKLEDRLITTKTALSRMTREHDHVTAQLTQAEQVKLVAEGELAELHKSSEEREGQVEELSQELKAARKELGRLHSLDQRVKDLLNDYKQVQADKDRCEEQIAAGQDDISRLTAKQAVAEKALEVGAAQVAQLKQALGEQSLHLTSTEVAFSLLKEEKSELEGVLAEVQARLDARDVQLQDTVRQLNISKFMLSDNDDARSQVSKLSEELGQVNARLASKRKEVESLTAKLAKSDSQLQQAAKITLEQEQQAAQLQAQVSAKERFIATLRRTITSSGSDSTGTNGTPLQCSDPARISSLAPGAFDQNMSPLSLRLTSQKSSLAQGAYDQEMPPLGPGVTSQKSGLSQQSSLSSEGSGTLTHRRSVIFMQKGSSRRGSLGKGQAGGSQGDNQQGSDPGSSFSQAALEACLEEMNGKVEQLQAQRKALQAQIANMVLAHAADMDAMTQQLAESAGKLAAKEGSVRGLLLRLEQAQEASGLCLKPSEQQMQAQLQDKDSQLQSARSSLGESEKQLKALQETVQQRGTAVPFLSHDNQSAQDAAQATEALQAVHRQQTMWLRTKAAMLANFSRGLRQELAEAKSNAAELEVAALRTKVGGLQSMLQQQQDFAHTLDHVCQVGPEVITGVQKQAEDVRQQVSALQQEAGGLAQQVAPALAAFLAASEAPPQEDKGTQAFTADQEEWQDFAQRLTKGRPRNPMSRQEVISSIVACYCVGLTSLVDASMQAQWGKDSIFAAMAAALTGSSAVQVAELMMETGPVGRLLTSARMYQNNLKVLIFCRLVDVVDGHTPSAGWHFFLQVLHCVKALQGDGWQALVQDWVGSDEAVVPIQCVLDVVGNAFNTNDPASLPVVQDHLLPLIQDSNKGPAIDLDALLLVLLEENLAGRCPCTPLLLPRRITDGSLANASNLKHAMDSPSSSTMPSPPGSASSRSRPSSGRLDSRASLRGLDRHIAHSGKSRPPSAGSSALHASAVRHSDSPPPEDGMQLPPLGVAKSTDTFTSLSSLVAKSSPRPGSPLQRNMSRGSHLAGPTTSTLPPIPGTS
ncbi:hypothetical protein WJX77_003837 [Trebouxia sp. C0004]